MNYYTFLNYIFLAPKPRNFSSSLLRNILVNYPLIFASSFFLFFFHFFFLEVTPLSRLMAFSHTKIIFFFFLPLSFFFLFLFFFYLLPPLSYPFLSLPHSLFFLFFSPVSFLSNSPPPLPSFLFIFLSSLDLSLLPLSAFFFLSSSLTFLSFFSFFDFQHVMVKICLREKNLWAGRGPLKK